MEILSDIQSAPFCLAVAVTAAAAAWLGLRMSTSKAAAVLVRVSLMSGPTAWPTLPSRWQEEHVRAKAWAPRGVGLASF